jgi:hypothetical protein
MQMKPSPFWVAISSVFSARCESSEQKKSWYPA